MKLRIGTRKSKLALEQTRQVCKAIENIYPNAELEVVKIVTSGDKITDRNLYDIGGKALFLKEIEQQLLDNTIDIAVHSLKDVPGVLPSSLKIGAVLERCDARDVLVSKHYKSIQDLPHKAIFGSSSMRRKVIVQCIRADIESVPFRGNVETRLSKITSGDVDATILASAGLIRLGILNKEELLNNKSVYEPELDLFFTLIDESTMLPAAGQGIIAIEVRKDDESSNAIISKINHRKTFIIAEAERSFLEALDASCDTPISAYARFIDEETIEAQYMIAHSDGSNMRYHTEQGVELSAKNMGFVAAKKLGMCS